ncbi:unnamed protein product [Alopecurus aequalis]
MVTFTGDDVRALFSHPAHHHGLKLVATDKMFQCDGCRQIGDDLRYRCDKCDFDLHLCCAQAPASTEHSLFEGCALTFFSSRPATATARAGVIPFCDVCGDPVRGFLYHNGEHDLDLHPFCATLPKRMVADEGRVLDLQKSTGHNCGFCGMDGYRGRRFSYRLQDDEGELVYLHVACLMEALYSGDVEVMPASSTRTREVSDRTLATVDNVPRRRGKFKLFCKIAYRVAMFSHSAATLNPLGVIAALT